MTDDDAREPLMTRPVRLADVPETGLDVRIEADPAERAAIAGADALVSLESLSADLTVVRKGERRAEVSGRLRARLTQMCVVTLEPFETTLEAEIEARFAAAAEARRPRGGRGEAQDAPQEAAMDDADPIVNGEIDLGALVEEFFTLNLDPHPRRPGARFDAAQFPAEGEASPFAALKGLKKE
ncbi:YceD family protein [Methylocella sp.]|uniref:YceD family protein n=1 Tax=Methylocella sp. TaxID=1978226 RepID=UPI0037839F17